MTIENLALSTARAGMDHPICWNWKGTGSERIIVLLTVFWCCPN